MTRRSARPNVETVAGEKNGRLPRITSTATTGVTSSRAKRNGRLSRITSGLRDHQLRRLSERFAAVAPKYVVNIVVMYAPGNVSGNFFIRIIDDE